jgi:threonine/homoserine/homoserine lactone efflux protein
MYNLVHAGGPNAKSREPRAESPEPRAVFDARYFAYATISAVLVISPGATMAVVMETAIEEGRAAAMYTVLGVNIGNSTLAIASALGMSFVFMHWPWTLPLVKAAGAAYPTYLGLRGLWFAFRVRPAGWDLVPAGGTGPGGGSAPGRHSESDANFGPRAAIGRGVTTNLLNPPVILFYMTFLPQFIGPNDPFFGRFLVLAATHVSMSLVWLSLYATALGVLAERMTRPLVRRALEGLTGVLLVGFGVRLLIR